MLKDFVPYFIPEAYQKKEEQYREARLLINTCFITALFSLSYISISLFINFQPGINAMLMNVAVFSVIPFLFRNGTSLLVCSNVYAAIGALSIYIVTYYSGGFNSSILPWIASTPIVVLLIAGKKSGWAWTIISLTAVNVFALLDINGYAFPISYNTDFSKMFAISTHGGLVLIVFLISLVFQNGKDTALFKLNLRNREVISQKEELEVKNKLVEEKNKDITDSIHYAKRIQRALLASDNFLKKHLPEYFVVYKPKDIVSGDFYWAATTSSLDSKKDHFLLCTADCTGHGVPGAFMSLLNINSLKEIVLEKKIIRTDLVLNEQRNNIIHALNPNGTEESKDGMDCTLCSFDFSKNILEISCANNNLWLIRDRQITEYKADKQPVGFHSDYKPFTLQTILLNKGDIIYTFTDGFADQFGGPRGKKFKNRQLQETLLAICDRPMNEQKKNLEQIFDDWKGSLEQVDDVLAIGIKV